MIKKLKIGSAVVLIVLILIVIFQNWNSVNLEFLFYSFPIPKALLVLGTALIGFIIGLFSYVFLLKNK